MAETYWYYVAAGVFLAYWTAAHLLRKKLEKRNISVYGPLLMVRTQKGQKLLDRLSKYKKFWRVYATLSYPLMVFGMLMMLFVIFVGLYAMLFKTPQPSEITEPRNLLVIPGVNVFIPLVWGWIALIVTTVVHELSHAVLFKVEGVKVKSMGLLLALIPLGAFTEADDEELEKADRRARVRALAAGSMGNFVTAFVAFILLFGAVMPAIGPKADGVLVSGVVAGYPAQEAGITNGSVITGIDNKSVRTSEEFLKFMNDTHPGQTVKVEVNGIDTYAVKLAASTQANETKGILGIQIWFGTGEFLDLFRSIPSWFLSFDGLLKLNMLPILLFYSGFGGFEGVYTQVYQPIGWAAPLGGGIFYLANALFWIFWLNLFVGLFNGMPALPFDGGHIMRDVVRSVAEKFTDDKDKREKIANGVVTFFLVAFLTLLVMVLVLPTLVHG